MKSGLGIGSKRARLNGTEEDDEEQGWVRETNKGFKKWSSLGRRIRKLEGFAAMVE